MSKKRGKNRPPKLDERFAKAVPERRGREVVILTSCWSCPDLVPQHKLRVGRCPRCYRMEFVGSD